MTTLVSGQVAVTSGSATLITPLRTTRTKFLLYCPVGIYLGPSSVTASTGYPPFGTSGQGGVIDLTSVLDAIYALTLGSNATVYYLDDFT